MFIKNYHHKIFMLLKFLILFGILMSGSSLMAQESYTEQLVAGTKTTYKHWNTKRAEITGYSHFEYQLLTKEGMKYIVEKNRNTKQDGEVFTKKTLWFDQKTGIAKEYVEEDLRKNFRITNTYLNQKVQTRLNKNGKVKQFETDLSTENGIPFEVVIFYLRKNLQKILQTKKYTFTLFLPMLAIELEEKGLPRSMSMINMQTKPGSKVKIDTPLGEKSAYKIIIFPESRMLRAILPKEKTHFMFTIAEEKPHLLLQFEEGETRHILTDLKLP